MTRAPNSPSLHPFLVRRFAVRGPEDAVREVDSFLVWVFRRAHFLDFLVIDDVVPYFPTDFYWQEAQGAKLGAAVDIKKMAFLKPETVLIRVAEGHCW